MSGKPGGTKLDHREIITLIPHLSIVEAKYCFPSNRSSLVEYPRAGSLKPCQENLWEKKLDRRKKCTPTPISFYHHEEFNLLSSILHYTMNMPRNRFLHPIKTMCVLGGSKLISFSQNIDIVSHLVRDMGNQKINLMNEGTSITFFDNLLMAEKCFEIEVKSIIPFHRYSTRVVKDSTSLMLTHSIYECMIDMVNNSDDVIILPGGYGTLMK
ncbi:Unknown protein, partial [Striga hermonthica]